MHLKVADLERALGFYHDVLGFALTQRYPGAAFLSAGGYHHHIGLNVWEAQPPDAVSALTVIAAAGLNGAMANAPLTSTKAPIE